MDVDRLVAVLAGLVLFGVLYNWLVSWLNDTVDHGYLALLVAGGTAVTLVGFGLLAGWEIALLAGVCFGASGAPMIAGSVVRHLQRSVRAHQRLEAEIRDILDHGNQP
jgi:hypothetical protein